jgi:hypothetical protein
MELLKKNLVSVVCGLIALVAIAAVFWPITGYYTDLKGDVEKRVQVYNEFKGLLTKERKMPIPSPEQTEGVKFEGFPTDKAAEQAKAIVEKVQAQSKGMYSTAVKINEHRVLVDGELTDSPAQWNRFRNEYLRKLEMPNAQLNPTDFKLKEYTIAKSIMEAGFAPTEPEILAARDKKAQEIDAGGVPGPGGGGFINQPQLDAMKSDQLPKVADELKLKAAQGCKLYIEPTALDPSVLIVNPQNNIPGMQGAIGPSVIWNAQIGLWIYEDVAKAIATANKSVNAKDVRESVVKHFVKIDVMDEPFKTIVPMAGGTEAAPAPNADPAAPITPNFAISPTGRTTNGVYDVVPFDLTIVVDAAQIPRVLLELSRGRFITVTNVSYVNTVDSALKKSEGFYYGDVPVVELKLRCEALFMRNWTEKMMPLPIKQGLGLAQAPQATPQ